MTTPTIKGDDMGDDEKNEIPEGYELDRELEAELEVVVDDVDADEVAAVVEEHLAGELRGMSTIEVLSNVNKFRKGDRFTVDASTDPWAGMIVSGVAQVVD